MVVLSTLKEFLPIAQGYAPIIGQLGSFVMNHVENNRKRQSDKYSKVYNDINDLKEQMGGMNQTISSLGIDLKKVVESVEQLTKSQMDLQNEMIRCREEDSQKFSKLEERFNQMENLLKEQFEKINSKLIDNDRRFEEIMRQRDLDQQNQKEEIQKIRLYYDKKFDSFMNNMEDFKNKIENLTKELVEEKKKNNRLEEENQMLRYNNCQKPAGCFNNNYQNAQFARPSNQQSNKNQGCNRNNQQMMEEKISCSSRSSHIVSQQMKGGMGNKSVSRLSADSKMTYGSVIKNPKNYNNPDQDFEETICKLNKGRSVPENIISELIKEFKEKRSSSKYLKLSIFNYILDSHSDVRLEDAIESCKIMIIPQVENMNRSKKTIKVSVNDRNIEFDFEKVHKKIGSENKPVLKCVRLAYSC